MKFIRITDLKGRFYTINLMCVEYFHPLLDKDNNYKEVTIKMRGGYILSISSRQWEDIKHQVYLL